MRTSKTYTRIIANPPSWMDAEEREQREAVVDEILSLLRRTGGLPTPIGELLASYVEGKLNEDELLVEVDRV